MLVCFVCIICPTPFEPEANFQRIQLVVVTPWLMRYDTNLSEHPAVSIFSLWNEAEVDTELAFSFSGLFWRG